MLALRWLASPRLAVEGVALTVWSVDSDFMFDTGGVVRVLDMGAFVKYSSELILRRDDSFRKFHHRLRGGSG